MRGRGFTPSPTPIEKRNQRRNRCGTRSSTTPATMPRACRSLPPSTARLPRLARREDLQARSSDTQVRERRNLDRSECRRACVRRQQRSLTSRAAARFVPFLDRGDVPRALAAEIVTGCGDALGRAAQTLRLGGRSRSSIVIRSPSSCVGPAWGRSLRARASRPANSHLAAARVRARRSSSRRFQARHVVGEVLGAIGAAAEGAGSRRALPADMRSSVCRSPGGLARP